MLLWLSCAGYEALLAQQISMATLFFFSYLTRVKGSGDEGGVSKSGTFRSRYSSATEVFIITDSV